MNHYIFDERILIAKNYLFRSAYAMSAITLCAVLLISAIPLKVGATSAWLSGNNPTLTQVGSNMTNIPTFVNGQPCQRMPILTKKSEPLSPSETWSTQCVGTYPYGLFTTSSNIQISDLAGPIKDYFGSNSLIPIPGSDNVISVTNYAYAQHYSFNYSVPLHLNKTYGTGTVSYQINTPTQNTISDAAGHALILNYNVMAFSSNGRYMVIDSPWLALLRVDMTTGVVVPFGNSFGYSNGNYGPAGLVAVSDDGNIVAVSGQSRFQIYDVSTCASVPSTITGPVSCSMVSLSSFWPSGSNLSEMNFVDDDNLVAYLKTSSSPIAYSKYFVTSYGHSVTTQQYLALGDSYSSGEGAYHYELGTDTSDNNCHLSTVSYPYLISQAQAYSAFHSVACSGAISANVMDLPQYPIEPQPNSLGDWMPGLTDQLQKVELSNPDIITVGIGGNDIGFGDIIKSCIMPGTCYNSYDARTSLVDTIDAEYSLLGNDYSTIKSVAKGSAKIYAIGYPQIVDPSGDNCASNVHVNSEEISLANEILNHLNYVIQQAATSAGIQYVDVTNAFSGHELCDPASNNLAMNGLVAGEDVLNVLGSESYHPNQLGHYYLEQAIMTATSNFGTYTPGNPSNAVAPTRASTTAQQLLGPYTTTDSNTIKTLIAGQTIANTAYKSSGLSFAISADQGTLQPSTSYTVSLDSGTTSIGSYATDSNGNLNVTAAIPSSVSDGVHTVDVTGANNAGETIDIHKTTAIGESSGSFNGTPDSSSTCILNLGSPQDIDQNGVDDNCQATIGRSPTNINNLYRVHQGSAANGEDPNAVYIERNVALANSMLGITDYDPNNTGWSVIGVASQAQYGSFANLKITDVGLTPSTYNEYVPSISVRSNANGCIRLTPASLSAVTSTSATTMTTTATNTSTCRTAAPTADLDNNGIPDDQDTLYRFRFGDPTLGESASDLYIERNINPSEAALGITDFSDNNNGWGKVAKFNSPYTYARIGLLDPTTNTLIVNGSAAFTSSILSSYTQSQLQSIVPIIAMTDGTSCYNYEPNSLTFVSQGQSRSASLLSSNVLSCN